MKSDKNSHIEFDRKARQAHGEPVFKIPKVKLPHCPKCDTLLEEPTRTFMDISLYCYECPNCGWTY